MSVDPSHYLPAANGGKPPLLKLQNISAKPELNGKFGQAVSFSAGKSALFEHSRYVVAIVDSNTAAAQATSNTNVQPQFLKLKPENLTEAGNIDQLKFGASCLFATAKAYIASPKVQTIGKDMISKMPPALQSKMTPNKALVSGGMVALLLIYMLYFILGKLFGATKVFVFLSLVGLILAVSSPDWLEGMKANKPINLIVKSSAINFRRRWKENLINMTGYNNISDNMALASFVFILLFSGKTLLARSPSSSSKMMPTNMAMGGGSNMQRSAMSNTHDLEYIYKLGWDDAKAGNEFGLSLPDDIVNPEVPLPSTTSQYNDKNFDYDDYNPPPLPPQNKSLGMGTMMSMFAFTDLVKMWLQPPMDKSLWIHNISWHG